MVLFPTNDDMDGGGAWSVVVACCERDALDVSARPEVAGAGRTVAPKPTGLGGFVFLPSLFSALSNDVGPRWQWGKAWERRVHYKLHGDDLGKVRDGRSWPQKPTNMARSLLKRNKKPMSAPPCRR